ncbi:unnamed protein product [Psylliodes chrysocephalus]|uniref:Uncharacterized protein n=1 Tax=Psylliodes chrysocephalus TaxID=3402493 RepID=A0A9P0D5R0_9CUCU|nr:unnamed protein product [Psylliodes chrysocephala]
MILRLIVRTAESLAPTHLLKSGRERETASVAVPTTVCSDTKSCQAHDVSARDEWMRLDVILRTLSKYPDLEETVGKFLDHSSQSTAIAAAREKFLVSLYGTNHLTTSLNALRYKQHVISASSFPATLHLSLPPMLQPTSIACVYIYKCSSGLATVWIRSCGVGSQPKMV